MENIAGQERINFTKEGRSFMLYAADFRAKGREALNGNWGKAIGVGFVASLLGAATTFAGTGGGSGRGSGGSSTGNSGIEAGVNSGNAYLDIYNIYPSLYKNPFVRKKSYHLIQYNLLHKGQTNLIKVVLWLHYYLVF